jgi:hypothetical protein
MEIADLTSTVRTPAYHGLEARKVNMEISCWRLTVRTAIPHGPDARSLIWKLLSADVRPSGWQCLTVRTRLSNRKDFQRKSLKFWSHSCLSGQPMSTVLAVSIYFTEVAHLNPQPINRGPWALRTARIWYWIPSELRELFCEDIGADLFSLKPLQVCCCCATTEVYLRGWL